MTIHCFYRPITDEVWIWDVKTLTSDTKPLSLEEQKLLYIVEEIGLAHDMDGMGSTLKKLNIRHHTNTINWIVIEAAP